jgi:sugar/nucleoside kinase (ribokinase family)
MNRFSLRTIDPVDYLAIGHISQDLTPNGPVLGGTVSYAALTARAIGLKVGIVTSCSPDLALPELDGITVLSYPSEYSTTFENIYTAAGRIQRIHHQASILDVSMVPDTWRDTPIVHLGPVAQEVDPKLARAFPNSLVGVTPQGWMRSWDSEGHVTLGDWPESAFVLQSATAAVLSIEDLKGDESRIEELLTSIRILAITEGAAGARVYWNGDVRNFRPPQVKEVDATGAGDVFAASFFYQLSKTQDPWEAARFANLMASASVTHPGLQGIPTHSEAQEYSMEVITGK